MIFPVAFATTLSSSSSNNDKNEEDNDNDEQKQQQNTKNDRSKNDNNNNDGSSNTNNNNNNNNPFFSSSSLSSLEQDIHCSKDIVPQPNYIDKNGCIVPCPTVNSLNVAIPKGCPAGSQTIPDSQNQQNNIINSPQGLMPLNNKLLEPNFLGKDIGIKKQIPDYIAKGYLTINVYAINFTKEMGDRISICVDTQSESGQKTMANPHCAFGANKAFKYTVQPGQIVLSIKSDIGTGADESQCLFNISPNESKTCTLYFKTLFELPKSNSNFIKKQPMK